MRKTIGLKVSNPKDIYLIDSENIHSIWKDLLTFDNSSYFYVFYTENSPHINYEDLIHISKFNYKISYIKCFIGNNALDFQLVSYLGYLIGKFPDTRYHIVSRDSGFDSALNFWQRKHISIDRLTLNAQNTLAEVLLDNNDNSLAIDIIDTQFREELKSVLPSDYEDKLEEIMDFAKTNRKNPLNSIYVEIIKVFGTLDGQKIYKVLKPYINKLNQYD